MSSHDQPNDSPPGEAMTDNASELDQAPPGAEQPPSPSDSVPDAQPTGLRRTRNIVLVVLITLLIGVTFGGTFKAVTGTLFEAVFGTHEAGPDGQFYTCGMHPWVILPEPGDCPICHMELTPLDPAKFTGEVTIDPVMTQNIGVRIAPVEEGQVTQTIRTVGTVALDETQVKDINLKVDGWIEHLYVDYLGAPVAAGDPLFELYSPTLIAAQSEFLAALGGRRGVMSDAARTRLLYFDVSAAQIDALRARDEPSKTLTIASPFAGVVVEKHAIEGMRVDPGMLVFRIADLSRVWVMVSVYEYQLPSIHVGQRATMTLPYAPGRSFEGTVTYIYPTLDTRTREVKVRVELDNADRSLKPGMFASVSIASTKLGKSVLAPRSAVLSTGKRNVAFVSLGNGKFEPRDVQLGIEADDGRVEVLAGLAAGEQVVVSGQFLLDSEAKTREALARMIRGDLAADQKPVAAVADAAELDTLPPEAERALTAALDAYLAIADKLASDATDGVAEDARALAAQVAALTNSKVPSDPHLWHRTHASELEGLANAVANAADIADARTEFAALSQGLSALLRVTGVPAAHQGEVQELHCPMFLDGSVWLQGSDSVRNPYYGAAMLTCFDKRTAIPAMGAATPADVAEHENDEVAP